MSETSFGPAKQVKSPMAPMKPMGTSASAASEQSVTFLADHEVHA